MMGVMKSDKYNKDTEGMDKHVTQRNVKRFFFGISGVAAENNRGSRCCPICPDFAF
jgi:hypothetical protein